MATLYCSPSGGGSGADFNNLATLPTTTGFVRGNVYVVVDGSYGSKTLSTPTSGTSTITIRKANAEDSTVAGYSTTLFDGVASFGTITVKTQYWIVDGITRTESNAWAAPSAYGLSATQIRATSADGDDADNSQFRYIDIGPAYDVNPTDPEIDAYVEAVYLVFNQADIVFHRCAMHNGSPTLIQGAGADNLTFEYCDIGPGWGKEAIRGGNGNISSGWTIRYCRFWNSTQTDPNDPTSGITAEIGIWAWTGASSGFAIYGNWFFNSTEGGRNSIIIVGGNGGSWAGDGADGTVCYNNTFAGIADSSSFDDVLLNGTDTIARNNLFYDVAGTPSVSADTVSDNDIVGTDPFANYAGLDFQLSGHTSPGFTLDAPYDTDPLGVNRAASGNWDVGAYAFDGEAPISTLNLTNLNVTTLTVG